MSAGKLWGVGIGPGDPELVTVKAPASSARPMWLRSTPRGTARASPAELQRRTCAKDRSKNTSSTP